MKKISLLALLLSTFLLAHSQTKNFIDQPYIEVNGTADTMVTPDEIYIRIQLSEKDTKDRVSLEDLEQSMATALKSLGIDIEKNLTTSDLASNYKTYLLKSKDIIKSKLYTLKVTDAVTATRVFIKLEEIGISNTNIDRVAYSDLVNLTNIMREKAVIVAKERALAMTKPLNQNIGPAIFITDLDNTLRPLEGYVAGVKIRGMLSLNEGSAALPNIEFDKIKVTTNVNVKFVLK